MSHDEIIETTALDTQRSAGIVCVAGDITEAITQYIAVKDALDLALPDCIMRIGNRSFRKKEYWRAVATAFNLNVVCLTEDEHVERSDDWGFEVTHRATAPNGRHADGDGSCYASEKRGQQATVHNVRAHAHTRAFNRAVSNLVGFGEVSADEINPEDFRDAPAPSYAGAPAPSEPSGDVPACPQCSGPMWDNRATKKGKQPDFKCKADRDQCNGAIWVGDTAPVSPPTPEANPEAQAKPKASQKGDMPPDTPGDLRDHDPSWAADRKAFHMRREDIGWSYDECKFITACMSKPRPSQMGHEQRRNFLQWLEQMSGAEKARWTREYQTAAQGAPEITEGDLF